MVQVRNLVELLRGHEVPEVGHHPQQQTVCGPVGSYGATVLCGEEG